MLYHPAVDHGGALDRAIARFGGVRSDWIDLSTGINPWPYPVPALPADAWTRLPDERGLADLAAAARDFYGAPAEAPLVAAPGSQALIQLLPRLVPPGEVAIVAPTYAEHARCWAVAGHHVRTIGAEALERDPADVLVVVNPNNPDGSVLRPGQLAALAQAQAARGGLLVVDEAFAEVVPAASLTPWAGMPGLVLLRSFGKFFGLAGLRLGFAFGPADLVQCMNAAFGPWAVAGPALAVGRTALADRAWAAATRSRLAEAARAHDDILSAAGLAPAGGTDLFRLARFADAGPLADRLGRHHILVRRFIDRPDRLRFGLPPDAAAEARLVAALCNKD
ncbi:threonine-phosphate decarboxylase [Aliidongia dinghuensis]|uniref:threonine-phosphate decarboxylase n=1 Tax=Aliidongia dinghuensis TaxID=1867774 RepID=A0A8J2YSF7_9PROT|nr:threonine-phosphate decarboxylase CobD [Aliidongia dinghuensis]GGF08784.1 threonine-phosphate decarboxylase [Aliidongia dinghuensis]